MIINDIVVYCVDYIPLMIIDDIVVFRGLYTTNDYNLYSIVIMKVTYIHAWGYTHVPPDGKPRYMGAARVP